MNETLPLLSSNARFGNPIGSSNVKYAALMLAILFVTIYLLWPSLAGSKSRLKIPGPQGMPLFGSLFDVSASVSNVLLWLCLADDEALSDK